DGGFISDGDSSDGRLEIDRAEFKINWDAASRMLEVPFQILSGNNRLTLLGQAEAPAQPQGSWALKITGGSAVLNTPSGGEPLIPNRIGVVGRFHSAHKRLTISQGDIGNAHMGAAMSPHAHY